MVQNALRERNKIFQTKQAKGIIGQVLKVPEEATAKLNDSSLVKQAQIYSLIADQGIGSYVGTRAKAEMGMARQLGQWSQSSDSDLSKALSNDYSHFAKALQAKAEGRYLELSFNDGHTEIGIVNRQKQREGMWLSFDDQEHLAAVRNYKNGIEITKPEQHHQEAQEPSQSPFHRMTTILSR